MADPPAAASRSATSSRSPRRPVHRPAARPDPHPARRRGPAGWTTKQITLAGLALTAIATLWGVLQTVLPDDDPAEAATRDSVDAIQQVAVIDGVQADVTSLSHLVVYVTMIDRTYFEPIPGEAALPRWEMGEEVRVPDGHLALSVPLAWAALEAVDGVPDASMLVGTQGVTAETYLAGGVSGIGLLSRADDVTPREALYTSEDWPGFNCIERVPPRELFLEEGLAALQVLVRCETSARADDVAWVQLAVDTGDRLEVIEVTITSLRDLEALSQILASLHLSEEASRALGGR